MELSTVSVEHEVAGAVGPSPEDLVPIGYTSSAELGTEGRPSTDAQEEEAAATSDLPGERVAAEKQMVVDPVRQYAKDAAKTPLLNAEQEVELAKSIEAGLFAGEALQSDESLPTLMTRFGYKGSEGEFRNDLEILVKKGARDKEHLLNANLRLVMSLAKRYVGRGMPYLDLVQEGNLGLIRAAEKFDYKRGYKFSTYATWWIRQSITRGLVDQARTIRKPAHVVEEINQLTRVRQQLRTELLHEPTNQQIADRLGVPLEKVDEIETYRNEPVSLSSPMGDAADDAELGEMIEDGDQQLETLVDRSVLRDHVAYLVSQLSEREGKVITLRYGLEDGSPQTLEQIATKVGVTRERIRQIEATARGRLKPLFEKAGLYLYLPD